VTNQDRRGVATSAADQTEIDAVDDALELFLDYELSAGAAVKQVLGDHPGSVLATVVRGYMMLMLETVAVQPKVAALAQAALGESDHAVERERLHLRALGQWAAGDVRTAASTWDRLLAQDPLDLLALKMHHYTTFWTGRANVLLATVESVLDAWDETTAGYDHVLGMYAFALNETGRFEHAEEIGRRAVAANAEDLWSVHAVAHALEMQGDLAGGDALFDVEPDQWATKNPFVGHMWWHAGLFAWSRGDYDRVLTLYDERLRPASTEFFLDLQNLSSLLTRLELAGVDVGHRWDELGDYAADRIGDHVLTFTDVHCALTLLRTGRTEELTAFTTSLQAHRAAVSSDDATGPATVGLDVAIELCHALELDAAGDPVAAAERLAAVRGDLGPIGGSHAQRDLFDLLLIDLVERARDLDQALALLRARARRWPRSAPTWHRYAAALAAAGRPGESDDAARRAMEITGS